MIELLSSNLLLEKNERQVRQQSQVQPHGRRFSSGNSGNSSDGERRNARNIQKQVQGMIASELEEHKFRQEMVCLFNNMILLF